MQLTAIILGGVLGRAASTGASIIRAPYIILGGVLGRAASRIYHLRRGKGKAEMVFGEGRKQVYHLRLIFRGAALRRKRRICPLR